MSDRLRRFCAMALCAIAPAAGLASDGERPPIIDVSTRLATLNSMAAHGSYVVVTYCNEQVPANAPALNAAAKSALAANAIAAAQFLKEVGPAYDFRVPEQADAIRQFAAERLDRAKRSDARRYCTGLIERYRAETSELVLERLRQVHREYPE